MLNNSSIINIKFIFLLLFILELKFLLSYSSNIYFFFIFFLVVYFFFTFFSNLFSLYDIYYERKQTTVHLSSLFYLNKIKFNLLQNLYYYIFVFKSYLFYYYYKLNNQINIYLNNLDFLLIILKNLFLSLFVNVIL